jgi:DNA (cytosine-5)-methyltransferase 1
MGQIKIASLFCGCGGTDLGLLGGFKYLGKTFRKNATKIIFANDIDNAACDIYDLNFPTKSFREDIKNVPAENIPDHDILTGGFPCQSFSVIAQNPQRLGYKSDGGRLFFEMVRILREKQPKCFVAENVKGILSANDKKAFPLILNEFKKVGYDVDYAVLNSAQFGIPQKRERVFIIGFRKDLRIKPTFPKPVNSYAFVPLKKVLSNHEEVDQKYYFSKRAVLGLLKSNPRMNKGRVQDENQLCSTVGAHLAKISLNSTDPVLKIRGKYRRFTPREVAKIQSFPNSFKLTGSDSKQYRALGNAIPPVLMWFVAQGLVQKLAKT